MIPAKRNQDRRSVLPKVSRKEDIYVLFKTLSAGPSAFAMGPLLFGESKEYVDGYIGFSTPSFGPGDKSTQVIL